MNQPDRRRDQHPWCRQAKESESSYAAFLKYRDMGAARSLEALNRGDAGAMPRIASLKRLSAAHGWVERSRAWDNHLQAERDRVAAEYAAMWERRRLDAIDEAWNTSRRLREKADRMLAFPLQTTETSKDGQTVIISPARWTLSTALEMIRLAMEIEANILHLTRIDPHKASLPELKAMRTTIGEAKASAVEADPAPCQSPAR